MYTVDSYMYTVQPYVYTVEPYVYRVEPSVYTVESGVYTVELCSAIKKSESQKESVEMGSSRKEKGRNRCWGWARETHINPRDIPWWDPLFYVLRYNKLHSRLDLQKAPKYSETLGRKSKAVRQAEECFNHHFYFSTKKIEKWAKPQGGFSLKTGVRVSRCRSGCPIPTPQSFHPLAVPPWGSSLWLRVPLCGLHLSDVIPPSKTLESSMDLL